jgi:hypothetical protein
MNQTIPGGLQRSEVLTAVVTKGSIFWEIPSYRWLKVNRRFVGTISPPSSGSKDKPSNKQSSMKLHASFLFGSLVDHEDGGSKSVSFYQIHGVTYQQKQWMGSQPTSTGRGAAQFLPSDTYLVGLYAEGRMRRCGVRWMQVWAPAAAAAGCCCHSASLPGPDSQRACNQQALLYCAGENFWDDAQTWMKCPQQAQCLAHTLLYCTCEGLIP